MPSHGRTSRRDGFTLIELLVVIAILSLLVSLLMPSLRKARELAVQVTCLTQMRGLALLASAYSSDNANAWPATANWNQNHGYHFRPTYAPALRFGLGQLYAAGYFNNLSLPCCPGHPMKEATTNSGNGACTFFYRMKNGLDYMQKVENFAHCLIVDRYYYFQDGIQNHPTGINAVFMDGSGRWLEDSPPGTWFNFTGHARNYGGPLFEVDANWPSAFYFDDAY
ncbi:MAG TPA: type II secretion system protein [Candidatus Hydrogenedentes bacterium]|nr:type II secretion system protein [Candidatus Hydrogenedentota bacterium]